MKISTITLPAAWASTLVNLDSSGIDSAELAEVNAFLSENCDLGACLSCSEEAQLVRFNGKLRECLDYNFPINNF